MAFLSGETTKQAGDFLLRVLKDEPVIKYDRFYDGGEECYARLCEGMGMTIDESEGRGIEHVMDVAISLLERQGIVGTRQLRDHLADGEQNYEITLTEKGRSFIASGKTFNFPDLDL